MSSNPNVLDSMTIAHAVIVQYGRASAGRDYYRFSHAGGIVHLDIDSDPQVTNFDTHFAIWDAGGNRLYVNDDGGGDPGDIPGDAVGGYFNSNLSNLNLTAGDYVVGVSRYLTDFGSGGSAVGDVIPDGGTYTLNISANVPEPTSMAIFGLGALGMAAYRARRKIKT
jgi:hypothetical protein